jgi:hypothetical protein
MRRIATRPAIRHSRTTFILSGNSFAFRPVLYTRV